MNHFKPPAFVTTSWDDGHPCDLHVAELLSRFGIPGTFYIPASSERERMDTHLVRMLADTFDIGAHTLRHLRLNQIPADEAATEITGSKNYLEQLMGRTCSVFAAPGGRFDPGHIRIAEEAGFHGFRTTELMTLDLPRLQGSMAIMPTTLQVFRHARWAYWRNAARRFRPANLGLHFRCGRGMNLGATLDALLDRAIEVGGVVHIWGHGWEIEESGDWPLLADILARIAERKESLRLVSNAALCSWVLNDVDLKLPVSKAALPG